MEKKKKVPMKAGHEKQLDIKVKKNQFDSSSFVCISKAI